jgi:hypothetical protein
MFPPGLNLVLRLPPTPAFFLYKNPGKVEPPNQNWPFELEPVPKADIYIIHFKKKGGAKTINI